MTVQYCSKQLVAAAPVMVVNTALEMAISPCSPCSFIISSLPFLLGGVLFNDIHTMTSYYSLSPSK